MISELINHELKFKKTNILRHIYWKDKVGTSKYGIHSFEQFKVKGEMARVIQTVCRCASPPVKCCLYWNNTQGLEGPEELKQNWGYYRADCLVYSKNMPSLFWRDGLVHLFIIWDKHPLPGFGLARAHVLWMTLAGSFMCIYKGRSREQLGGLDLAMTPLLSWRLMLCWAEIGEWRWWLGWRGGHCH